jgi:hypothetical protein
MDPTAGILEIVMDPRNVGVIAIAAAVITFTYRVLPPRIRTSGWVARVLPVLPVPLCMAIVWIPGLEVTAELGAGDRLALGAALGCGLAWGYKVLRQSIMGRDERIKPKVAP